MPPSRETTILLADDDPDDRLMVAEAFAESGLSGGLDIVENGADVLAYLCCQGKFSERDGSMPWIILLDLKMPVMDGRQTLKALKSDPTFRRIPVVMLTTSSAGDDLMDLYDLGANSYITKPDAFDRLVRIMNELGRYWLDVVALPDRVAVR